MKIESLLEIIQTSGGTQQYRGKLRKSSDYDSGESGAFARVVPDKKDPHMVRKFNHTPMDQNPDPDFANEVDNYAYFALWMATKKIYNVCLPRVYDIRKIKDSRGKFIYKYQLEKLSSWQELDLNAVLETIKRFINMEEITKAFPNLRWTRGDDAIRNVGRLCESYLNYGKNANMFRDEELVKALDLIRECLEWMKERGHKPMLDIENSGNIMFRQSRYGYQLVITDPIS